MKKSKRIPVLKASRRPYGIATKVFNKLNRKITKRQIQRILAGTCADMHSVKETAIEIIKAEKQAAKEFKKLTTKTK